MSISTRKSISSSFFDTNVHSSFMSAAATSKTLFFPLEHSAIFAFAKVRFFALLNLSSFFCLSFKFAGLCLKTDGTKSGCCRSGDGFPINNNYRNNNRFLYAINKTQLNSTLKQAWCRCFNIDFGSKHNQFKACCVSTCVN